MPTTPQPDVIAPALEVALTDGSHWSLAAQTPESFTMIVVYRGLHCPVCRSFLQKLVSQLDEFTALGVSVLALSMDDEERAKKTREEWDLGDLPLGHSLTAAQAAAWGLYLSEPIKDSEPGLFAEPGLFWVRPDGRLFLVAVSNSPHARPDLDLLLEKASFIIENDYPARGVSLG